MTTFLKVNSGTLLEIPSITFSEVTVRFRMSAEQEGNPGKIVETIDMPHSINVTGLSLSVTAMSIIVNGKPASSYAMTVNEEMIVSGSSQFLPTITSRIEMFYRVNNLEFLEAKFTNGINVVAHYDMSTGTVEDQSGNGNHATLTGGEWVGDGGGDTDPPPDEGGQVTYSYDTNVDLFGEMEYIHSTLSKMYEDTLETQRVNIELFEDVTKVFDNKQIVKGLRIALFDSLQTVYRDVNYLTDLLRNRYEQVKLDSFTEQNVFKDDQAERDIEVNLYKETELNSSTEQQSFKDVTWNKDVLLKYNRVSTGFEKNFNVRVGIYKDAETQAQIINNVYKDVEVEVQIANDLYKDVEFRSQVINGLYKTIDAQMQIVSELYEDVSGRFDMLIESFSKGIKRTFEYNLKHIISGDMNVNYQTSLLYFTSKVELFGSAQEHFVDVQNSMDLSQIILNDQIERKDLLQIIEGAFSKEYNLLQQSYTDIESYNNTQQEMYTYASNKNGVVVVINDVDYRKLIDSSITIFDVNQYEYAMRQQIYDPALLLVGVVLLNGYINLDHKFTGKADLDVGLKGKRDLYAKLRGEIDDRKPRL